MQVHVKAKWENHNLHQLQWELKQKNLEEHLEKAEKQQKKARKLNLNVVVSKLFY